MEPTMDFFILSRCSRRVQPRFAPYRPRFEVLESRCVPSTVTNLLDAGPGSLRQAIVDTPSGSSVDFQADLSGAITLSGTLVINKDLTIAGPGQTVITVDGNRSGSVFNIALGSTVSISGLTIANGELAGFSEAGGGIYNNGTLSLTGVSVQNNLVFSSTRSGSADGGGIYNNHTLTISDSTFSGNVAAGLGGTGGGAISSFGTLTITDSVFIGNEASGASNGGGAIENSLTMTVTGCTFLNNVSSGASWGGAVVSYGTAAIADSTFSGNTAGYGGAVGYLRTLTVSDCTISANSARISGGGLSIVESEIGGTVFAHNTLIARNTAPSAPDVNGSVRSQGYNLVGNGSGSSGFGHNDHVGTASNPIDPLLGPLEDNGGPTLTMAPMPGSPVLNAGDPAQLGVADQRGVVRSGGVNVGAYQASASAFVLTAPATAMAGGPFDLAVNAVDRLAQPAVGYRGTAHFSSSDPLTVPQDLPGDYTFTNADAGMHTFSSGVTLKTAGNQTVTAVDTATGSTITGNTPVSVNPAAADHLLFLQQPTDTAAGQAISPVIIEVVDQFGNVVTTDSTDTVTLSIGNNPSNGTLSGTLTITVTNGIATFSDLSIDLAASGYTVHATIGGSLPDIDSNPFNIT
jgi:hypothetical protein